jgi:hypothetical protein
MSRYIAKVMNVEKPKQIVIWEGGNVALMIPILLHSISHPKIPSFD